LKSSRFNDPKLFTVKAQELPLSGQALLDLMRAVLDRDVPFRFCARGWSMTPFIRDGDVITVAPLQQFLPGVGQVVAFVRPDTGSLVVHRVVARRAAAVLIQGDNGLEYEDGHIPQENLLGRVTRIERNGRSVCIGLGPERYAIAWLSRIRLLAPLRGLLVSWLRPFYKRSR
jgi:hypothetical protein